MNRRNILIAVLALSAFGLTTGLTASLNVSSDQLGAGTNTVASCDPDGVGVSYGVTPGQNSTVASVTLTGVHADCVGQTATVILMEEAADGTITELDQASATVAVDASGNAVVNLATDTTNTASAAAVEHVSVIITG